MKKIMNYLMLSCKKATSLIEKKLLINLTAKEKIQLALHKSMCDACTAYEKQSKKMDEILKQHILNGDHPDSLPNSDLKEKVIDSIKKN